MIINNYYFKSLNLFLLALTLRLILLTWGYYQDEYSEVPYTDVDYKVITDGAKFLFEGKSPYLRSTYRYTPLLAYLVTPNHFINPNFGKWIFSLSDLICGYLLIKLGTIREPNIQRVNRIVGLTWLLNPFVATISTRGNCESVLILLILSSFYYFLNNKFIKGSILFGLSVQFKLYPVIYSVALLVLPSGCHSLINTTRIELFLYSAATFFLLNAIFYLQFGSEFLEHTYFYHVTRKDHRHNFSIWFLPLYLTYNKSSIVQALISFVPQLASIIAVALVLREDLIISSFLQTFLFVAFNKVSTSQYFIWYLALLPLVILQLKSNISKRPLLIGLVNWIISQLTWLGFAYLLEFKSKPTFIFIWIASIWFFLSHIYICVELLKSYTYLPLYLEGKLTKIKY
ncbi:glycosyltransferase family 50 protein [Conidiobolus coronatus NRRL 28638]|uniref:GPI mannosyltransferase 1 n=1 Tax=Conidiobolus coronatus (strain ATCC 28846 / CBS 209.66 / NRRL 28638) TaxID=796925 RepID=A0A137PFX6_CONC2|nr:glycosyltransferase family 50 protein [Conidiobolus coronatus NRRL 28638]|eukprot:KXN73899.1 glycosyltransferase family 50 protein [Conidiobolus coronatus NRRL 28638]